LVTDVIAPAPSGPPSRCVHEMVAVWCGWCLGRAEWAPLDLGWDDIAAGRAAPAAAECAWCGTGLRTGEATGTDGDGGSLCWRCVE
jgi:hypothetical protein